MVSSEEKARRKALKQGVRQEERDQIRSSLPISQPQMRALFDSVDQQLTDQNCDDTLKYTLAFLNQHGLSVEPVIKWLEAAGAYCDCEVLANAEQRFLFAFGEE
jgi:hypothetical protein